MASLSCSKNGLKTIQFTAKDSKRRSIRLGKLSKKAAESVKMMVEHLVTASITGHALDNKVALWLAELDDVMLDKLARVGLAQPRESALLKSFIDGYIAKRKDVKASTATVYTHTRRNLIEYFGPEKPIREISEGDADEWRLFLIAEGLADNTVRRRCGIAKQFFKAAMRKTLIDKNPFADLKAAVRSNTERFYFVKRDEADKVMESCPDAEWRLIFALSRYGGLRCPSEHLALKWGDIDWSGNRFTVHSSKTEHLEGRGSRVVPLFPELLPHLQEVYDAAEEGTEYVITRYRSAGTNLRTQLMRIIERAGLKPWPKLFQNLRSTRETELAEQYPMHVICSWIGNTQAVAIEHYLQVTDEHFEQAAEAVQNPVQQAAASQCEQVNAVNGGNRKHSDCNTMQNDTTPCTSKGLQLMGQSGLEPPTSPLSGVRSSQLSY